MSPSRTNGAAHDRTMPLTGQEYLESLRDGREVWIRGERIVDLPNHPVYRNAARMIARLYDALHDPARQGRLLSKLEPGSQSRTHRFFCLQRSIEDLVATRDAIAEWARLTYGWMGQGLEEGAGVVATLGAHPECHGRFEPNARAWYRKASERALFLHHVMVDPRRAELTDVRALPLHVERETDAGLVINGNTTVPSCAALSHCSFVVQQAIQPTFAEERHISLIVPMNTPGVKLHCRPTPATSTKLHGSPFDYPLTSRLEEDEALLTFEKALIPWENVLAYRDANREGEGFARTAWNAQTSFQESTRLSVKLEFIAGLLLRSVEASGTGASQEVRAALGELLSYRNLFWGLTEAQARAPAAMRNGLFWPNYEHGLSYRIFSTLAYPRLRDVIERTVGNGHVFLSANASDFMNPEAKAYLERFVRGANGYSALDRVKLTKLLWDALGGDLDSRATTTRWIESPDAMRIDVLDTATASGLAERCRAFAGQCLEEYDIDGWHAEDLFKPSDPLPDLPTRRRPSSW